jgi:glycerol-3-phosphate acyltransferase PlsY
MINVILVVAWILVVTMALTFWISPKGCRYLSLRLFARAEQLEIGRKTYHDTIASNMYL